MTRNPPEIPLASILIVDDTIAHLRLMFDILSEQGYRVRQVPNGQMALTSVKAAVPDLILLDISMPGLNGYEVCRQLKASPQTAGVPVIFISALDEALDKVKAFALGGADYINKPFQFEEILARVKTQLTIRSLQQQLQEQQYRTQEAEINYHRLFENAMEGIYQMAIDGCFSRVNLALAQMYGYESPQQLLSVRGRVEQRYVNPNQWYEIKADLEQQGAVLQRPSEVYGAENKVLKICESIRAVWDKQEILKYYEGMVDIKSG
ncbi:response regulator [Lusitaniella coriacea LEGE 07157]|uniref:Response regulator n=1 Tax=Lusitaniella coriacea LEGE 07157 TaxID=945747 RepID=A0A8J7DYW8_9CYAN|nr:response regulator [Lusitaniella coriacea]MBE9116321.1 response regulator [Lusitaniella coriacea LEGE 07157]